MTAIKHEEEKAFLEGPHSRTEEFFFMVSLTRKMSFHTRIPLLAIPDFYNPEYSAFWKVFAQGDFVNEDF